MFESPFLHGLARTQISTNTNCADESPMFGKITGVNPTRFQWKGLALEEPPSWSRLTSQPGKYELYWSSNQTHLFGWNTVQLIFVSNFWDWSTWEPQQYIMMGIFVLPGKVEIFHKCYKERFVAIIIWNLCSTVQYFFLKRQRHLAVCRMNLGREVECPYCECKKSYVRTHYMYRGRGVF